MLEYLNEKIGHWKLKEEALGWNRWVTRFGRGFRAVVMHMKKLMNAY
jgi:hypothetical protein